MSLYMYTYMTILQIYVHCAFKYNLKQFFILYLMQ